ncbi:hypothetical protein TNCT_476951, partial [Trichonephila clavata]
RALRMKVLEVSTGMNRTNMVIHLLFMKKIFEVKEQLEQKRSLERSALCSKLCYGIVTALSKNYAAIRRLHISAKDRKSTPSTTEQGSPHLNEDFSYDELLLAVNALKKEKSTGADGVLLELIIRAEPTTARPSLFYKS